MPTKIRIQFYVFDAQHRAIPIELAKPNEDIRLWKPAIDLITHITDSTVLLACGVPEWLQTRANPDKWEVADEWEITPRIIILLTSMKHLHSIDTFQNIVSAAQGTKFPLRSIKKAERDNIEGQLMYNCPVIMIGTEDIMDTFTESPSDNTASRTYQYRLALDPRIKYWDSGIWHRYVPLDGRGDGEKTSFSERFKTIFDRMCQWYTDGLYSTFVALENIEFQTRLMLQSSIAEVGQHGHEERVTPFKFHSETQMEQMSQKILDTLGNAGISEKLWGKIKWRLLLVDDQGESNLSCYKNENNEPYCTKSKKDLIEQQLNGGLPEPIFEIVVTQNSEAGHIDSAMQMLKKETYDVILLDYLLGQGNYERNGREYGYDFLRQLAHYFDTEFLEEKEAPLVHKGPLGRFWVFQISSFPFAFADKLRQLGMSGYSDYWHLTSGGDPVCTPALFRFKFLNFIKQQIAECYLYPEAMRDFFHRFANIENGILWRDLVCNCIEQVHLRKSLLENDDSQGSEFSKTMLSFIRNDWGYTKMLDSLKSFVNNIKDIPYFRINESIISLAGAEGVLKLLTSKSGLFFKAEKKLKDQIEKFQVGDTLNFDSERLRWLPANIGDLAANLKVLRLSNNQLTSLPKEIGKLGNLEKLDISYNQLESLSEEIRNLKKLEFLDLTGNKDLPEFLSTKHEGKKEIAELFKNIVSWNKERAKKIVISYAHQDSDGVNELEKILKVFERDNLISFWKGDKILPGDKWDSVINAHFMGADIILLLVSMSFLASDYIYNVEMKIAMARHKEGNCVVVPVIYKACDWQPTFLGSLQVLPHSRMPIQGEKTNPDESWKKVSEGIRKLLKTATSLNKTKP